jgi:hypothetical protein
MNEAHFGNRIRQALNHGVNDISPASARRLEAARHLALSRRKQTERELAIAGHGLSIRESGAPYSRQILAIIALLVGMWLAFYWHSVQYISELEEVDSALLSGDLPPEAFLDNDLLKWLQQEDSLPD